MLLAKILFFLYKCDYWIDNRVLTHLKWERADISPILDITTNNINYLSWPDPPPIPYDFDIEAPFLINFVMVYSLNL